MQLQLPDPSKYNDPIRYFRDSHKVIGIAIAEMDALIAEAEKSGMTKYFQDHPDEAKEMIQFFTHVAPMHEMDEEKNLFPVLREKLGPIGFQIPNTTPAFLIKEHEEMNHRARIVAKAWHEFEKSGETSLESETLALNSAKELVHLYKGHVAEEDELIYKVANDNLLTPEERISIMNGVIESHSEQIIMPTLDFDTPMYSTPDLQPSEEEEEE